MGTKAQPLEQERQATKRYRLGLYDPLTGRRVKWEGGSFRGDARGAVMAKTAIRVFNRLTEADPSVTLCLGIFECSS